jgi:hypothetical protein
MELEEIVRCVVTAGEEYVTAGFLGNEHESTTEEHFSTFVRPEVVQLEHPVSCESQWQLRM